MEFTTPGQFVKISLTNKKNGVDIVYKYKTDYENARNGTSDVGKAPFTQGDKVLFEDVPECEQYRLRFYDAGGNAYESNDAFVVDTDKLFHTHTTFKKLHV